VCNRKTKVVVIFRERMKLTDNGKINKTINVIFVQKITSVDYNHTEIEEKWRAFWKTNQTYKVTEDSEKEKYYVLDMFPYPSGAGLHVGHPLGYIASDVFARYKRLQGYNVLHPMGYDSFGLPAEQYAIQTGQHPQITTEKNIQRYRQQLDKLGFSYDWSREIRTSDSNYYKWTQWVFIQLFNSWYNKKNDRAEDIKTLVKEFETSGNIYIFAETDCQKTFDQYEWNSFSEIEKETVLHSYRLAYLTDAWVNWCPELGTVLANDEIINGRSERGGFPVEQKLMRQWTMRIKAYAERLLTNLDDLQWTDAIKEMQRNWIGKSVGATVNFKIKNSEHKIEIFTTRPDTIFGVTCIVLAPEHPLVKELVSEEFKENVEEYVNSAKLKTERDRQMEAKNITGQRIGSKAIHPFTGEEIEVWIADYVLASYGTGAVMAVPAGDQRDWNFAKHFNIKIKNIFLNEDNSTQAYTEKDTTLINSNFLNGLSIAEATEKIIQEIEQQNIGESKINYRLRNAVFARQRYWGEPFPIYYKDGIPKTIDPKYLPLELPEIKDYLPTSNGQAPLGNAKKWAWSITKNRIVDNTEIDHKTVFPIEQNTMPGWAGSSWYFMRYTDPKNNNAFAEKEKLHYWKNVDLYIGGAEHATGHLLYARFWTKFLFDRQYINYNEPFQRLINQGMILGRSSFVYRNEQGVFVSKNKLSGTETPIHVDISLVENDKLNIEKFKVWRNEYADAKFILEDNHTYICGFEIEKMSKSKFNVQTPDELIEQFGADTLRCYELFLGPIEQAKPWDTKGINGVANFLRKLWRLFQIDEKGKVNLTENEPTKENLKTIHRTIKRLHEDINRYSFNTCVSNFMICVNELTEQKCYNKHILEKLVVLLSPFAPYLAEELWEKIGYEPATVTFAKMPQYDERYLQENSFLYPVSFNGKVRFKIELSLKLSQEETKKAVLANDQTIKILDQREAKKVIVVHGKIVNIVI